MRGEVLYFLNRYSDSIKSYKKAIQINPNNYLAYYKKGMIHYILYSYYRYHSKYYYNFHALHQYNQAKSFYFQATKILNHSTFAFLPWYTLMSIWYEVPILGIVPEIRLFSEFKMPIQRHLYYIIRQWNYFKIKLCNIIGDYFLDRFYY